MSCTSNSPNINNTFNIEPGDGLIISACTMLYTNDITPCTGTTLNVYGDLDTNAVNAEIFYSGGTNLLSIFGGANTVITAFTYNDANIISIETSGGDFSVDIGQMSELTVTGGITGNTFYGDGSNLTGVQLLNEAEVTTTGDTPTSLDTITGFTSDETRFVESYVTAHNSATDYGFWKRTLAVVNVSGTTSIILENAETDIYSPGLNGVSIVYTPNGADIDIDVIGETGITYNWISDWNIIRNS